VSGAALIVAALATGAVIAAAISTGSLGPIWSAAWIPAVLAGVVYRPGSRRRCADRLLRRSES
jgi:hypothetical protein